MNDEPGFNGLQLEFLGTGGAFTDFRENYHNNAVVTVGPMPGDGLVLIDCGATAVQSLKELDYPVWGIEAVVITHLHGDHIAGLEQLIWERYYTGPQGPGFLKTPIYASPEVHTGLRAILTPCIDEYTDKSGEVHSGGYDELIDVKLVAPGKAFAFGQVVFKLHPTEHVVSADGSVNKPAFGVEVFDSKTGGGFYYTSDTTFRPGIGALFPHYTIFHDCTFAPIYPGTVHTHYAELLMLPDDVRERIILMHHTKVPQGINYDADGFVGAAERHDHFSFP